MVQVQILTPQGPILAARGGVWAHMGGWGGGGGGGRAGMLAML